MIPLLYIYEQHKQLHYWCALTFPRIAVNSPLETCRSLLHAADTVHV